MGYNESTAIQKLHNFGTHYFVLAHATSDANVNFLVSLFFAESHVLSITRV